MYEATPQPKSSIHPERAAATPLPSRLPGLLACGVAGLFILLAVIGGIRAYSPVPFWDMVNGYLDFYVRAGQGDLGAWWAQHNEHRIVLARGLFWLDLHVFRGAGAFLIVCNYLLAAALGWTLWRFLQERLPHARAAEPRKLLAVLLVAMSASWMQEDNFTWGFQSQFFLAQLLPLLAFYALYRSTRPEPGALRWFAAAAVLGGLSIVTMANGALALPLLTLVAIVIGAPGWRIAVLGGLAAAALALYFHNYVAPAHHGSLRTALAENPAGLLQFTLMYLGGPFYHLARHISMQVALVAGAVMVLLALGYGLRALFERRRAALELCLLGFLLYVGGSAFGTAGGRLLFGLEGAFVSRYMTPALLAWSVLLILLAPRFATALARYRWLSLLPLVICLAMLPTQLKTLKSKDGELFERDVAALALKLRVRDEAQIGHVYPQADEALQATREPVARHLSVFGMAMARRVDATFSQPVPALPATICAGSLDEAQPLAGESNYVAIRGWLFAPGERRNPTEIVLADTQGRSVGYALVGQPRPDVAAQVGEDAARAGFKGYLRADQIGKQVSLVGSGPDCQMQAQAMAVPYIVQRANIGSGGAEAKTDALAGPNGWTGSDYQHTRRDGYEVIGSLITSDADTGEVSLQLRRGERIYYRSGPVGGHQRLTIESPVSASVLRSTALPIAPDWVALEFAQPELPETFTIKLSDQGAGWGEWSAIALRKQHESSVH